MHHRLIILIATLGLSTSLGAQNIPAGENLIIEGVPSVPKKLASELNMYTNSRSAGFVDFHPIHREILVSTRFGNTAQLHVVKQALGMRKQLTFFEEPVGAASYQPTEGKYFVFSRDAGGNEFGQLYRYDMQDGRITLLTDGGRSQNGGMVWSHKGDEFLYASTKRNGADRDIYLMNPENPTSEKLIVQNSGGGWGAESWAPDDKRFIMGESISVNESRLWLVDAATGEKKRLSPETKEQAVFGDAEFSSDGKSIYLLTDLNSEFLVLAKMDLSSGKIQVITSKIPWDVSDYEISPDGSKLVFVTNEAGLSKMYLLDTSTDTYGPVNEIPEGIIGGIKWHNNNKDIAITHSHARSTADVYLFSVLDRKLERWTESELGGLNPASLSPAELIRWKSFDGQEISGFYYKPSEKFQGKRPVMIIIHGGPEGQSFPGFQGRNNYYLNELGIALIYPNVRGSTGYGKSFVKMDNGYLRENSVKDIGALLDWIAKQPDLDASRVMTMGGSYGGYSGAILGSRYYKYFKSVIILNGVLSIPG
ncbi:MAG: S9 family peptidase [Bacteroidota bacterium]